MTKKEVGELIINKVSSGVWTPLEVRKLLNKIKDERIEVDIDFLKDVASMLYGVDSKYLTLNNRKQGVVFARNMCFKYLKDFGYTWESIGQLFDKDHATALHGVKSLDNALETNYIEVIEKWQKFNEIIGNKVEIN